MRHLRRQKGLTLVEIMVALLIGLFLSAGMVQLFITSKSVYRTQEALSRIQENGRFVIGILARDLRMSGFLGCQSRLIPESPRQAGPLGPGVLRNTLNPDPPASPAYKYDFSASVRGYKASGLGWSPSLPQAIVDAGALTGRDVITLSGATASGAVVTAHPGGSPPGSADIKVSKGGGFQDGDFLLVSDCQEGALFQATNVNDNALNFDNLVHNTGGSQSPGNWTKALGKSFVGGEVFRVFSNTYFIATGSSGQPALFRVEIDSATPLELAEGITGMQILYGIDTSGNRVIDQYVEADTVTDWNAVVAVRISLLAASSENNIAEAPLTLTYDGASYTAADRRLYQVFTTTIGLRNRLP